MDVYHQRYNFGFLEPTSTEHFIIEPRSCAITAQ